MKKIWLIPFVLILFTSSKVVEKYNPDEISLSHEEKKLFDFITNYRDSKGLPFIPVSAALTQVAQTHVLDLQENRPAKNECNLHSWSDQGPWSECCYTGKSYFAYCVWDKPKELTDYKHAGFEIAVWMSSGMTAEIALEAWQNSPGHNDMVLNESGWTDKWEAIGIGLYGEYAVVWFGKEPDPNSIE